MIRWLKYVAIGGPLVGAATAGVLEETLAVPSGFQIAAQERLIDTLPDGQNVLRLRFVMPEIATSEHRFEDIENDFEYLCNKLASPSLADQPVPVTQVIVSLSDRETEFGVSNPDATQYFEAFKLETDICIWEGF